MGQTLSVNLDRHTMVQKTNNHNVYKALRNISAQDLSTLFLSNRYDAKPNVRFTACDFREIQI